jgi:hypothetical protein
VFSVLSVVNFFWSSKKVVQPYISPFSATRCGLSEKKIEIDKIAGFNLLFLRFGGRKVAFYFMLQTAEH